MQMTLSEIADLIGGELFGDGSRVIRGVCAPGADAPDAVCAVWDRRALSALPETAAAITPRGAGAPRDRVELDDPRGAMPALLARFDSRTRPEPGISPNASIDPTARIGDGVHIGPWCVISRGAVIGDRAVLMANVYIGPEARVGDDTVIEPFAAMMDLTEVGSRSLIHSGAKIGCDGFGFIPRGLGKWEKIPQIGRVVIGDDVEIGPNCSIDRAMFGTTRIGDGAKIGALTQVAHNCELGRGVLMSGFSGMAGSVKIGDGTVIAGLVGIADHTTIGRGVTVAGRSGITKDIPDGVTVSGYPAQDHRAEGRLMASIRRVPEALERIKTLERDLASVLEMFVDGSNEVDV